MDLHRGAAGKLEREIDPIFIGEVATNGIITDDLRVFFVHFPPGARTTWHAHASDQVLIVTEGTGIVATEETEVEVRPGDVVVAPAGEKHWHGATATTAMTHIAVLAPGEEVVLGE